VGQLILSIPMLPPSTSYYDEGQKTSVYHIFLYL